jgi:integrase
MRDLGKQAGLVRRKSTWYYRTRIPKDLIQTFGRQEVWTSLRTTDRVEAQTAARIQAGLWGARFAAARDKAREQTDGSQHSIGNSPRKGRALTREDAVLLARQWFRNELTRLDLSTTSGGLSADEIWEAEADFGASEAELHNTDEPSTLYRTGDAAARLLNGSGKSTAPGSELEQFLRELLRRAMLQLVSIERSRFHGDYSDRITDSLFASAEFLNAPGCNLKRHQEAAPTLGAVAEHFWRDQFDRKGISAKTERMMRAALDHMVAHFGAEVPVSEISRPACKEYRDLIGMLPPNARKRLPEAKSLRNAVEMNADGRYGYMAWDTQSTYVSIMTRLFAWANSEAIISFDPARGIVPDARKVRNEDRRAPFSPAQLKAILQALPGRDEMAHSKGLARSNDAGSLFWAPLIALFTGMRMGEILQLRPTDVRLSDSGTPFIFVHDEEDGMRLKTPSAKREVPIHPELARIGLVALAQSRKARQSELLFPDVPAGADGYRSSVFSKRFAAFLKKAGIQASASKVSFHSFRHNFRDALRRAGVPEETAEALGGWSRSSKVSRSYGSGFDADTTYPELCRISYPGLDLSTLASRK